MTQEEVFSEKNCKYVQILARQFSKSNPEVRKDLEQEGYLALISAAKTYDENSGAAFITYALNAVRWRMLQSNRKNNVVVIPNHVKGVEKLEFIYLDSPLENDDDCENMYSIIPSDANTHKEVDRAFSRDLLHFLIDKADLSKKEKYVILSRIKSVPAQKVAEELKLSRQRVAQLEQQACEKMRKAYKRSVRN